MSINEQPNIDALVSTWNDALASGNPAEIADARRQVRSEVNAMIMADDPNYQAAGYNPVHRASY